MAADQTAVAIVGGGFSGTMVAAQLARRGVRSILIEGGGRAGRGTAYSTDEPSHLLNVRAQNMSAWPDVPDDFVRRIAHVGRGPGDYAQRRVFGAYLSDILREAVSTGLVAMKSSVAQSASMGDERWHVRTSDGGLIEAAALVLAIGNQAPDTPAFAAFAGNRFIANPWGDAARSAIGEIARSGADALLVGTGLTMVDLVLSLDAGGHKGRIVALSRRGLVPKAHGLYEPAPIAANAIPADLNGLLRWLRRRGAEVGWRAAVDSLRPLSRQLWQGLELAQQKRFLRHARPWWDVHRHRIAPEVSDQLKRRIAEGRLEIVAGRVGRIEPRRAALEVSYRRRGTSQDSSGEFAFAFNCTGPLHAVSRTGDPLLRSLLDNGCARPDSLDIGLEVDERSRVAGARNLWALGPLTKGRYWEIVAVPDIRGQAADVAVDIARELDR